MRATEPPDGFIRNPARIKRRFREVSPPPGQEASRFQVQTKQSAVIAAVMDEPPVQKAEGASGQIPSNCPRKLERKSSEATNVSSPRQVCEPFSRLSVLGSNRPHMHTPPLPFVLE